MRRIKEPGRLIISLALPVSSLLLLLSGNTLVGCELMKFTTFLYAIIWAHKQQRGNPPSSA